MIPSPEITPQEIRRGAFAFMAGWTAVLGVPILGGLWLHKRKMQRMWRLGEEKNHE